jgi:twitching motility protein PilT
VHARDPGEHQVARGAQLRPCWPSSPEERGIILLTGTTGSGKSTTLAAIIDHINRTSRKHIVTIEDPIEFLHRDRSSIINQREVGMDTASFKRALRRVLRQDPDVILVGEMRDEETGPDRALAAETGPPRALHAAHGRRAETINRIIDFFPPHQHSRPRDDRGTLKGIVSQRLGAQPPMARAAWRAARSSS